MSAHVADEEGPAPYRVAAIVGSGRSGSTVLELVLGVCERFVSVGELVFIWERGVSANELCGCGSPFRDCPFWTQIGEAAFGGWERVDASRLAEQSRRLLRRRNVIRIAFPRLWPSFHSELRELAAIWRTLLDAIARIGGALVVVDSSKTAPYALFLQRVSGIPVQYVHLVRDSRAVAYAWTTEVRRPEVVDREVLMPRYGVLRSALAYVLDNAVVGLVRRLTGGTLLRYEDLTRDPEVAVARVLAQVLPGADLPFSAGATVDVGVTHTVAGNPIRLARGPMRIERRDEWREKMSRREKLVVGVLTLPFQLRYGYVGRRAQNNREALRSEAVPAGPDDS